MEIKSVAAGAGASVERGGVGSQGSIAPVTEVSASASDLLHKDKFELSVSDQAFRKAIERANKALDGTNRRFEYSVHEKTGEVIVKVINQDTDELVREIPNEKLLDLMAKLQDLAGLNIDEKR